MTKGKPWSVEEEKRLIELYKEKKPIGVMAELLGKTKGSVYAKCDEMGLKSKEEAKAKTRVASSSNLDIPEELPSIEEALKMQMRAMRALEKPGLTHAEILRLKSIVQGVKIYNELFADYVDYRGIELELIEMKNKLVALSQPHTSLLSVAREPELQGALKRAALEDIG